jgi:hypothetical protein
VSLWAALSGAVAAILTVVGAYLHGRKMGAQAASERALRDQVETRERIDDATIDNDLSLADRFLNHRLRKDADR